MTCPMNQKFILIIFLGLLVVSTLAFSAEGDSGANWPAADFTTCDFYLQAENIMSCSNNGSNYLTDYGFKYCSEFKKRSKNWSPQAQVWTKSTGQCLQEMLRDNRETRLTSCQQMESFAFDSHPICYKQYNFCKLPLTERFKVVTTVQVLDLLTVKSLTQGLNIAIGCIKPMLSSKEMETYNQIKAASIHLNSESKEKISDVFTLAPLRIKKRKAYFIYAQELVSRALEVSAQLKSTQTPDKYLKDSISGELTPESSEEIISSLRNWLPKNP